MTRVKNRLNFDIKSEADGTFSGTLSTYGNVDLVGDICEKGCFDASLSKKGTHFPLLFNHDDNEPIGSFNVTDSSESLSITGKFNLEVQRAKEIHALVKAGDVNGLSIGYIPVRSTFDENGVRHLIEVELFEGSVTPFPANPLATAEAKKMGKDFKTFRKALIRNLKSKGKSDEEIEEIVEGTEKEIEEDGKAKKESEETEEKEEPTEESEKDGEEETEEKELTDEEIEQLKQLCKQLKEEADKLKEEMEA